MEQHWWRFGLVYLALIAVRELWYLVALLLHQGALRQLKRMVAIGVLVLADRNFRITMLGVRLVHENSPGFSANDYYG